MENIEARKIEIATIHHIDGAGFGNEVVQDVEVVNIALGNLDKAGNVAAQIQQGVDFDCSLALAKPGPRKQGKTKIDGRGIQCVNGLFQFDCELVASIQNTGFVEQDLGKVGIDPPIPILVGVGQGAGGDSASNSPLG